MSPVVNLLFGTFFAHPSEWWESNHFAEFDDTNRFLLTYRFGGYGMRRRKSNTDPTKVWRKVLPFIRFAFFQEESSE
ncbi:hypothetical protein JTE90_010226 [Oedothorax gibbosus]|uniref:Uncharacterized protein n=1 Tax=Oedothorax gibbosus TaxID=931172 RepID=A0AAV6UJ18_9ARAC|nr:hypothetical protein JTE90_010226 [Oedothorax gibbosus]